MGPPPMAPPSVSLPPAGNGFPSLPPVKPVFGVSLDDLYARDGTAVPMIVYQCFQAVELFGLDMEGIYRLSGSANHINHMKSLFDNGEHVAYFYECFLTLDCRLVTSGLHQPRELLPRRQQRCRIAQAVLPGPARPVVYRAVLFRLRQRSS